MSTVPLRSALNGTPTDEPDTDLTQGTVEDKRAGEAAAAGAAGAKKEESSLRTLPAELVTDLAADVKQSLSFFLLCRVWYRDIDRRVGHYWHKAAIVLGTIAIPFVMLAYVIELELNPPHVGNTTESREEHHVYFSYIASSFGVSLVAQSVFTLTAVCTENVSLLLCSVLIALAVTLRICVSPVVDDDGAIGRTVARIIFQVIISVLFVAYAACCFMAWHANDGFRRFLFFALGGPSHNEIERYRIYEIWVSSSRVDLFFCLLSALGAAFFMDHTSAWHFVIVIAIIVVNALWRTLLQRTIRSEMCISDCMMDVVDHRAEDDPDAAPIVGESTSPSSTGGYGATQQRRDDSSVLSYKEVLPDPYPAPAMWSFWTFVTPLNLISPVLLGFALVDKSFLASNVPDYSSFLVFLSFACFLLARCVLVVTSFMCWRNFGRGMKAVFERERGVTDFLVGAQQPKKAAAAGGAGAAGATDSVLYQPQESDAFAAMARQARA